MEDFPLLLRLEMQNKVLIDIFKKGCKNGHLISLIISNIKVVQVKIHRPYEVRLQVLRAGYK